MKVIGKVVLPKSEVKEQQRKINWYRRNGLDVDKLDWNESVNPPTFENLRITRSTKLGVAPGFRVRIGDANIGVVICVIRYIKVSN